MGVRGLYSFLQNNYEFFKDFKLQDSCLIIDGNNLLYFLYNTCAKTNSFMGGDYDKFFAHVQAFLKRLIQCRIKPWVIIDGSYDHAKLITLWKRMQQSVRMSVTCKYDHRMKVIPIFAEDIFMHAARSTEGVYLVQSFYEADSKIAHLASALNCPVLSGDSDFIIFDVNVIPINHLENQILTDDYGRYYMPCKMFDRDAFLRYFGIKNRELLLLLATLMGNDFISSSLFTRVFNQVKIPKKKILGRRHKKMLGLLHWLSRATTLETALQNLLEPIPKCERKKIRDEVEKAIDWYKLKDLSVHGDDVLRYFDDPLPFEKVDDRLLCKYRDGLLPGDVLDVVFHRRWFLLCQVEDKKQPSPHLFARQILKVTCEVIKSAELNVNSAIQMDVAVVLRAGSKCVKHNLKCDTRNFLYKDIVNWDKDCRRKFIATTLGVPNSGPLVSDDLKLTFYCLRFWCSQQKSPMQAPHQMELCAILLALSCHQKDPNESVRWDTIYDGSQSNTNHQFTDDDLSEVVHSFANLQCILYYATILNRLLDYPFPELPVWKFWRGTFLANVSRDFNTVEKLSSYLSKLNECLHRAFIHLRDQFGLFFDGMNNLQTKQVLVRRKNKKIKNKKVCYPSSEEENSIDDDLAPESEEDDIYHDLNNKFALLAVGGKSM